MRRLAAQIAGSDLRQLEQRDHKQSYDVDDLDQRVDGRARGVLVRVADRVAGYSGFMRLGALTAIVAFLDVLLGVVPGPAPGGHGDRDEEAGHDGADEKAAERLDAGAGPEQVIH